MNLGVQTASYSLGPPWLLGLLGNLWCGTFLTTGRLPVSVTNTYSFILLFLKKLSDGKASWWWKIFPFLEISPFFFIGDRLGFQ